MLNSIELGKNTKLICDYRLDTFDTVLNNFNEIHFNAYRTSDISYKNRDIVNKLIKNIIGMIATNLSVDGDIVMVDSCDIVFVARNTNSIYIDDNDFRFKLVYNSGDIIRFRRYFDVIEIKTMYN